LLLAVPVSAEELRVDLDKLDLEHRIDDGQYRATGRLEGSMAGGRLIVVEVREPGRFGTPVFSSRGGAVHAVRHGRQLGPEVVESTGRRLVFRIQPVTGPFRQYRLGSAPPEEVEKKVASLLESAGISRTHKTLKLETDSARREFLVRANVLALSRDQDVPAAIRTPFIPDKPPLNEQAFIDRLLSALKPLNATSLGSKVRSEARKFCRGQISPDQMRTFVRSTFARAELSHLKSKLNVPLTVSSRDSLEALEGKLHAARLIGQIQQLEPNANVRGLTKLDPRELRDRLNALTVSKRIRETGTPAGFGSAALPAAILRTAEEADPSPESALSRKDEGLSSSAVEKLLDELGLARSLTSRSGMQGKREALYQVLAWRAVVRQHRLSHLDSDRVRKAVTTRQPKRLENMAQQIAKAQPKVSDPREAAIRRLVAEVWDKQKAKVASGISREDLRDYYAPFLQGDTLGDAYRFLSGDEQKTLADELTQLGLRAADFSDLPQREVIHALHAARQIILARTSTDAEALDLCPAASRLVETVRKPGQSRSEQVAELWRSFRRYVVSLSYDFDPPEGPDRNSSWRSPERLGLLSAGTVKPARIELCGRLEPGNGDALDWWFLPQSLAERKWTLVCNDEKAVLLASIPAGNGKYLKVHAHGKRPVEYRVSSEGEVGGKDVRRFERREFHKEIKGPPF